MAEPAFELRPALTYATHDGVALQGDLYLPKAAGPAPALIAVHGGGWQQGARSTFQHWGPYLAARGYALFSISYRFARKGTKAFPEAVRDVLAAIQYLRGNAAALGIDGARIGLFGASAGAHLGALAALGGRAPALAGGYPDDPHAGVDTDGQGADRRLRRLRRRRDVAGLPGDEPARQQHRELHRRPRRWRTARSISTRARSATRSAPPTRPRCCSPAAPRTTSSTARPTPTPSCARSSRPDSSPAPASCQGAGHYWVSDPLDEPGSFTGFFAPRLLRFLAEKL